MDTSIPAKPDLIITADVLHTMSGHTTDGYNAIAVAQGKITAVGHNKDLLKLRSSETQVLEFAGAILPAFTDAHAHPIMSLSMARGADLSACRSLNDIVSSLQQEAKNVSEHDWVMGWGLDPNFFTQDGISNKILVEALGHERKAYVTFFDAHSAVASPAALEAAGIHGERSWPSGSRFVVDKNGSLSGHVLEFEAMSEMEQHLPALELEDEVIALHALLADMAAQGIGEVHVMDMNHPKTIDLLKAAERHAMLPVKLRISPWCTPDMDDAACAELVDLQNRHGQRWLIEGVKFFIDGTVEGGTAWLETPDSKGESTSSVWGDVESYARRITYLHNASVPTATHAIGERGIREVVETLAALPRTGVQHRIEHIESVSREVIDAMAAAGIAASMQPTHCTHYTKADGSDDWSTRLGPERAARAWCTRDVIDAGAILALGSDYPVAPYPVLAIMADAQLRRPVHQNGELPIVAEQAITAAEALAGYTTGPQRAIGKDSGQLEVGSSASFLVLDRDPLSVDPETLAEGKILLTVSEGEITYQAE